MDDFEHARLLLALKAARQEVSLLRFALYLAKEQAIAAGKRTREEHEKLHARIERLEQQLGRLADLERSVVRHGG